MLQRENVTKRLFNTEEYRRLLETGILSEDDQVGLIEGEIVEMSAMGSRRAACVDRINKLLVQRFGEEAIVRVQSPVRLSNRSEPEPDVALLGPRKDFYAEAHPTPEDVLLIVEVSETSVEYDSNVKLPLYASAEIPETWIVNLPTGRVEVYSRPVDGEYREITRSRHEERISSRTVSGISASEILG
jgi:Uma2 family endonuclease